MTQIQIKQLTDLQKKELGLPEICQAHGAWSVWECDASSFDWHYDELEEAYFYEGDVIVKTKEGQTKIKAGDFVTFPAGLSCTWTIIKKVRKVYSFQ